MTLKDKYKYVKNTLLGVEVPKAQGEERRDICKQCDKKVKTAAGDKCSMCGCFLAIMPYYDTHILKQITEGVTKVKCEHPEGNKWEKIDKKYIDA